MRNPASQKRAIIALCVGLLVLGAILAPRLIPLPVEAPLDGPIMEARFTISGVI